MADTGGGVSLAGLGLTAAGWLLMYSGVNDPVGGPLGALRDILRGHTPTPGVQTVTAPSAHPTDPGAGGGGGAPGPGGGSFTPPSSVRARVVAVAKTYMGVPYKWAGASRSGVDCSGLVLVAYRDGAGINLPHKATLQAARGHRVPRAQCQAGDLVAWGVPGNYPHIALAVDNTNAIVASTFGTRVSIKPIDRKAVPGYGYPDIISLLA